MMKKFLCFLICTLMLMSLCACNRGGEAGDESSYDVFDELSVTPEEDFRVQDTESGDGVSVTYYYGGDATVVIPETIGGKTVTEVNITYFAYNQKTKEIYIPDTVKTIAASANLVTDENVSALETVHLPEGLETIDRAAFKDFKNLKSINLPDGLKSMGAEAFYGCTSLESVNVPACCFTDSCWSLFAKSGLKRATIPEGVEIIPDSMFVLTKLESITVPQSVKTLDYYCLYGCPLREITLPEGLEVIDSMALAGTDIRELVIPKSVKMMEYDAIFTEKLERVTFLGDEPAPKYADDAFDDMPEDFFEVYISKDAEGFGFPRWKGHPVRYFDSDEVPLVEGDFEYVEIENGVRITSYFGNATEIIFPSEINGRAVLEIGDYMFSGHEHIRKVVFPETLESIGRYAFNSCERLTAAELPDSLKVINDCAFAWCENLKDVVFPESLESIGSEAFRGCDSIEAVVIPSSVTFLGESIFANSRGIKTAVVNANVKSLGHGLFFDCTSLESCVLPETLEMIDDFAFGGDSKLTAIEIPSGVKSIGYDAFESTSISSLTLPDGLESIDEFAFQYMPITELTLPASLKTLHPMAFNLCYELTDLYFLGDAPETIFEDDTWSKPNRVDLTIWYYESAQGFDAEFWQNYPHALIEE